MNPPVPNQTLFVWPERQSRPAPCRTCFVGLAISGEFGVSGLFPGRRRFLIIAHIESNRLSILQLSSCGVKLDLERVEFPFEGEKIADRRLAADRG
jgi:hypothetical protein